MNDSASAPADQGQAFVATHVWKSEHCDWPCALTGREWRDESSGEEYVDVATEDGTVRPVPKAQVVARSDEPAEAADPRADPAQPDGAELSEKAANFAACLAGASELKADDAAAADEFIANAAAVGFSAVEADVIIKAIAKAAKIGVRPVRAAWAKAADEAKKKAWEAGAAARARRTAEEEAAKQRDIGDERKRLWDSCRHVAESETLLTDLEKAAQARGVVGEAAAIRGAYLAGTSRLLVSHALWLLRRGAAAAGKNYLLSTVFSFFPDEDIIHMSSGSPMSLVYYGGGDEDALKHKILYIQEAVVLAEKHGIESPLTVMLRALISEGRVDHHVALPQANGPPSDLHIRRNGPTAVVLTSARSNIESELLTRLLTSDADESRGQTLAVVKRIWTHGASALDDAALEPWLEFQRWLALDAPYDVSVPFGEALFAALEEWIKPLPATAQVRLRRDAEGLLSAIKASAVVHRAQRSLDASGRIEAKIEDYRHAYEAFDDGISALYGLKPMPEIVEVVKALEAMGAKRSGGSIKVTVSALRSALGLNSNDVASRRLWEAVEVGFLKFDDDRSPQGRGRPRYFELLVLSSEIPGTHKRGVFPPPDYVRARFDARFESSVPYCAKAGHGGYGGQEAKSPEISRLDLVQRG
jgi:hypothetical protein